MQKFTLEAPTVHLLLQNQPEFYFDCSTWEVDLTLEQEQEQVPAVSNANRKSKKAPTSPSVRISALKLVPLPALAGEPFSFEVHITPHTSIEHLETIKVPPENGWSLSLPEDCINVFLRTAPHVELYPLNNHLGLTKRIPLNRPYTCTIEETRLLLQTHIPDLPIEIIQCWPPTITVAHDARTQPALTTLQHWRTYQINSIPSASSAIISTELKAHDTDYTEPHALYSLRNAVLLAAMFPSLQKLCSWYAESPYDGTTEYIDRLPSALNPEYLYAEPLPSTANSGTDALQSPSNLMPMWKYFPQELSHVPLTVEASADEIQLQIIHAILNAKAAPFRC